MSQTLILFVDFNWSAFRNTFRIFTNEHPIVYTSVYILNFCGVSQQLVSQNSVGSNFG